MDDDYNTQTKISDLESSIYSDTDSENEITTSSTKDPIVVKSILNKIMILIGLYLLSIIIIYLNSKFNIFDLTFLSNIGVTCFITIIYCSIILFLF